MTTSHLQTRTLTDALDSVDVILASRGAHLKEAKERRELAGCFSTEVQPEFESWAFSAAEFEEVIAVIGERAPDHVDRLHKPDDDNDFTIVGHCSVSLPYEQSESDAESIRHTLNDGTAVDGVRINAETGYLYKGGLVNLPIIGNKSLFLFQPTESMVGNAAQIASATFENRGKPIRRGLTVTYPKGRTQKIPDCEWVTGLSSEDKLYSVKNYFGRKEAILNEKGFFAQDTMVVQMKYLCAIEPGSEVVFDGPFLAFHADNTGVHAAAWFDHDSFAQFGE